MNLYFNTPSSVFIQDDTLSGVVWDTVSVSSSLVRQFRDPENPIRCSYSSRANPELLVDVMKLGDGYEQASPSGIRASRLKLSLNFDNRNNLVSRALARFFVGEGESSIYNRHPAEWFYLKVPAPFVGSGELRKFRVNSFSQTPVQFNSTTTNVEIEEVFVA
jgi:phage-related protein